MSSFVCTECGCQKDVKEAAYMDLCKQCNEDTWFDERRQQLYDAFGLNEHGHVVT